METFNNPEVIKYLDNAADTSKIYLGCDSQRKKMRRKGDKKSEWYAVYTVALVIHIECSKGCKLFYITTIDRDYDQKLAKPSMRLMNEVYKVAQAYTDIVDLVGDREVEIHLDINPKEMYGSNCVAKQAIGYIQGVCQLEPKIKWDAWCASKAADHGARFKPYS